MHLFAAEDIEVAFELLRESGCVPIEETFDTLRSSRNPVSLPSLGLRGQHLLEVDNLLLTLEEQLTVLSVHHVNRVAEYDDNVSCREILDLAPAVRE